MLMDALIVALAWIAVVFTVTAIWLGLCAFAERLSGRRIVELLDRAWDMDCAPDREPNDQSYKQGVPRGCRRRDP